MPLAIRIAALALLALTAAASAEPVTVAGIVYPDRVGEFSRGSGRDYEKTNPGLGYSFAYHHAAWTATVYVYDDRRPAIADGPDSATVKAEFAEAKRGILGMLKNAEFVRDFTLPARGTPRFICANFKLPDAPGDWRDSTLCVTAAKGKFVKFRVTGPNPTETVKFIEAWDTLLRPGA